MTARSFILTAFLLAAVFGACAAKGPDRDPRLRTEGDSVVVDISSIEERGACFYRYRTSRGDGVDFFVYRDGDGRPRASLDACRKCYRWRKGYTLTGEYVVCRKCGERFELESLHVGRGSCVPIPLPSSFVGDELLIPVADLESGARYF